MNKKAALFALTLGMAVGSFSPAPVLAQAAEVQSSQGTAVQAREVSQRDMTTMRERFDMWRQMRAAKTPEKRAELRAAKHAELAKRAAEKGLVLREPSPMMMHNGAQENGRMGGGEGRMGMMGQGGGGMHARPPMAP